MDRQIVCWKWGAWEGRMGWVGVIRYKGSPKGSSEKQEDVIAKKW